MSIKYNEFGEVISVNGLTTGQHLGTPMQDALGTEQENAPYGEEVSTVTRAENNVEDKQPASGGTSGVKKQYVNLRNGLVIPEGAPKLKFYTNDLYDDVTEISFDQSSTFSKSGDVTGSGWVVLPDNKIYGDDGTIVCDYAYDASDLSELWQEGVCIDFTIGASPTDMWKAHFILQEE